jgi:hypothetical protein
MVGKILVAYMLAASLSCPGRKTNMKVRESVIRSSAVEPRKACVGRLRCRIQHNKGSIQQATLYTSFSTQLFLRPRGFTIAFMANLPRAGHFCRPIFVPSHEMRGPSRKIISYIIGSPIHDYYSLARTGLVLKIHRLWIIALDCHSSCCSGVVGCVPLSF